MSFVSPENFWLLLTLLLIFILHILARRRRDVFVPSLFIWKKIDISKTIPAAERKFKINLILILQVITVVLLTTALANPFVLRNKSDEIKYHCIIDATTSMLTEENGSTRLEKAINMAEKIAEETPAEKLYVITNKIKHDKTNQILSDSDWLKKNKSVNIYKQDLSNIVSSGNNYYHIISDKTYSESFSDSIIVENHIIGEQSDNIGIVEFNGEIDENNAKVFVKVKNFTYEKKSFVLNLSFSNSFSKLGPFTLEPNQSIVKIIDMPEDEKDLTLEISEKDGFIYDNIAKGYFPLKTRKKLTIAGNADESVIKAIERILNGVLEIEFTKDFEKADLIIVKTYEPIFESVGKTLIYADTSAASNENIVENVSPELTAYSSEINDVFSPLESMSLSRILKTNVPNNFDVISKSNDFPIIAKSDKIIYFGFDITKEISQTTKLYPVILAYILDNFEFAPNFKTNYSGNPEESNNSVLNNMQKPQKPLLASITEVKYDLTNVFIILIILVMVLEIIAVRRLANK